MDSVSRTTTRSSKNLLTLVGFVLLVVGIIASIYVVSQPQDTREQAQVVPTTPPAVTCTSSNPSTTSNNSCAGDLTNISNSCQTIGGQSGFCRLNTQDGQFVVCDCIAGQPTTSAVCSVIFTVPSPTPTPSNTPTPTPSNTPTPTPSNTPTPTPSRTPTPSPSPTPTNTATPTPTPSRTPSPTPSNTPTPTPSNTPTPTPSSTPLLLCLSIQLSPANPTIGQSVTLTCGNVIGAYRYEFRLGLPDGSILSLSPVSLQSNISQPYTIVQSGPHGAQCRLCMGPDAASCQSWEQP